MAVDNSLLGSMTFPVQKWSKNVLEIANNELELNTSLAFDENNQFQEY